MFRRTEKKYIYIWINTILTQTITGQGEYSPCDMWFRIHIFHTTKHVVSRNTALQQHVVPFCWVHAALPTEDDVPLSVCFKNRVFL